MLKQFITIMMLSTAALAPTSMATAKDPDLAYKITDDPTELTIHLHFRNRYVWNTDYPTNKEAFRLTNIHLKGVASMATTNSNEAFNLMMASRDLPDIVGGSEVSHSLKPKFIEYGMEGAFEPLDPLIEEHAPNLKKFISENKKIFDSIRAPDGNLYYIPYIPDGKYGRAWFIRKDWLRKLGLKEPQNIDELYEVGKAFRDRDPNGNGKKDEIFYFVRNWEEAFRLLVFWGGRASGSDTRHDFFIDNDKVKHPYAIPEYQTGMKNIAKWYAEGLIDQEFYTRDKKGRDYALGNNLGGLTYDWFGSTSSYNDTLKDKFPGFEFTAFLPPADIHGKRYTEHRRIAVKPSGWAITSTSEHKVEAIKYFDFIFTEAGRRLFNFGVEGQHYDMVDGKPIFNDAVLKAGRPVNAVMWDAGAQIPIGFHQDFEYEKQWLNKHAMAGIELYDSGDYLIDEFLGVAFTKKEKRLYDRYWPSILTYMLEVQQAWTMGTKDVDAEWDGYQKRLKELGFDKVMKVMQDAYDRQYKS